MQQTTSPYCIVALRYALYVFSLFTLCWWRVALVCAVYHEEIRICLYLHPVHDVILVKISIENKCGTEKRDPGWFLWLYGPLQVRLNIGYFKVSSCFHLTMGAPFIISKRIICVSYKSALFFCCCMFLGYWVFGFKIILTELTAKIWEHGE